MSDKYGLVDMDVDLAPSLMRKGTNAAVVAHVLATRRIAAEADINDPNSLMACLEKYLLMCMEQNVKVTNMAAYAACGVSGTDVRNWETGRTRANDKRYKEFAILLKSICSQYREQSMVEGLVNPIIGIWHQKAYDNLTDRPMIEAEHDDGIEVKQDPDEIAEKYKGLLDVNDLDEG